jgi:hypothetical protein
VLNNSLLEIFFIFIFFPLTMARNDVFEVKYGLKIIN